MLLIMFLFFDHLNYLGLKEIGYDFCYSGFAVLPLYILYLMFYETFGTLVLVIYLLPIVAFSIIKVSFCCCCPIMLLDLSSTVS